MNYKFRCDCPFTSALDVLGDKWMLVIIKQILIEGKETFKDFMECEEAIASNILSTKLKQLEAFGVIKKTKRPNNKKTNLYLLTDKGLALAPLLVELAVWSDQYLREVHPALVDGEAMQRLRSDKKAFALLLEEKYREKLASTKHVP